MTASTDVLVVGAGTTGLTLALQAHDHGASVRVVDRRPDRFRRSRAMMLHARALECLRPLGVTAELLKRADTSPEARIHIGPRVLQVRLGHADLPGTAFPHLTLIRQADVEDVLCSALRARGVPIDWGVEFIGLSSMAGPVPSDATTSGRGQEDPTAALPAPLRAELRSAVHGPEQQLCRFLAGCDGQMSTVRGLSGAAWRGDAYRVEAVLADLELQDSVEPGLLHASVGRAGLAFFFALGEGATWRMLATRPAARQSQRTFGVPGPPVSFDEVARLARESGVGVVPEEVRWSAQVPLQHRLASTFSTGRIFLAGDAAHAHSPAGGQGMNNGILDAANLGWKLGAASSSAGAHCGELLDSYGQERRPAARLMLVLTHVIFFAEASLHPAARWVRGVLLPLVAPVLPLLLRQRRFTSTVIRLLAQPFIRYRGSIISRDVAPHPRRWPRPGDRLPDMPVISDGRPARLHDLTATPGFHLLLERDAVWAGAGVGDPAASPPVHVHRLTSQPGTAVIGVRPDGHVGFRCGAPAPGQLQAWLVQVGAVTGSREAGGVP